MPRSLVHIGYMTAGSSWLRSEVFRSSRLGFRLGVSRQSVFDELINPHVLEFDGGVLQEKWRNRLNAPVEAGIPVISHERLAGSAHSGGYDCVENLVRLRNVLPDAKVLIVVRRQEEVLFSSYERYVRHAYGPMTLGQYLDRCERGRGALPEISRAFYRYDALAQHYREAYGSESVLVLPIELAVRNLLVFVSAIRCFVLPELDGVDPVDLPKPYFDSTVRPIATALSRVVNRLTINGQHNPCPILPLAGVGLRVRRAIEQIAPSAPRVMDEWLEARWRRKIGTWIGSSVDESNRRLQAMISWPLCCAGYRGVPHRPDCIVQTGVSRFRAAHEHGSFWNVFPSTSDKADPL